MNEINLCDNANLDLNEVLNLSNLSLMEFFFSNRLVAILLQ